MIYKYHQLLVKKLLLCATIDNIEMSNYGDDEDYNDFDITYNDTYGDMQIVWMGDDIDFELKCLRQSYWYREITRFDHDLEAGMIDQFYDEFVQLRTNEYEKWFI